MVRSKVDTCSAGQEILAILWNQRVHCRVLEPAMGPHPLPVESCPHRVLFKFNFNVVPHLRVGIRNILYFLKSSDHNCTHLVLDKALPHVSLFHRQISSRRLREEKQPFALHT
jgi:hypothetical protein